MEEYSAQMELDSVNVQVAVMVHVQDSNGESVTVALYNQTPGGKPAIVCMSLVTSIETTTDIACFTFIYGADLQAILPC